MKKCMDGRGNDSTSLVLQYLTGRSEFILANLYLIGRPDDPASIWLTDYDAPILWPVYGMFYPAVISRGSVSSKIGLDVTDLEVTWSPPRMPFTQNTQTASPYQLASIGYYDNWDVRVWTCFMPTPGDAMTLGCCELFGGRVADTTISRGAIVWKVNSFLDVVNQFVPTNVIEMLNTAAAYTAATPPPGYAQIPQFVVVDGSTVNVINGQMTSPSHDIFAKNGVRGGYLVFNSGGVSTLGGMWSPIDQNTPVGLAGIDSFGNPLGPVVNQFILTVPMPWPPTPTSDTFYVSGAAPINQQDGSYYGFPYVPAPTVGI